MEMAQNVKRQETNRDAAEQSDKIEMVDNVKMPDRKETIRAIKFAVVSVSAGIVEAVVFTAMNELGDFSYWVNYLTALICSIIWCYTVNRRYTFKSDKPMKTVLLYAAAFYAVFTPATTLLGNYLAETLLWNAYAVTAINMALNLSLEYLYDTFIVYRNDMDNNAVAAKEAAKNAEKDSGSART